MKNIIIAAIIMAPLTYVSAQALDMAGVYEANQEMLMDAHQDQLIITKAIYLQDKSDLPSNNPAVIKRIIESMKLKPLKHAAVRK